MCPSSLDSKEHVLLPLWSFQGARGLELLTKRPHEKTRPPAARPEHGLSKLNSVESEVEVDVVSRRALVSDGLERPSPRRLTVPLVGEAGEAYRGRRQDEQSAYRGKSPGIP